MDGLTIGQSIWFFLFWVGTSYLVSRIWRVDLDGAILVCFFPVIILFVFFRALFGSPKSGSLAPVSPSRFPQPFSDSPLQGLPRLFPGYRQVLLKEQVNNINLKITRPWQYVNTVMPKIIIIIENKYRPLIFLR